MSGPARAEHAFFPGTFDPLTLGHLDLVRRATALFGRVTVAVAINPEKKHLFSADERVALAREACVELPGVEVVQVEGLVALAAREHGCGVIVRGVRGAVDLDYEVPLMRTNRELAPSVDTVLMVPDPATAHVSSTLVRQIAAMGGPVESFVPPNVARALAARFEQQK